ncbi:ABC transporter permease [Pseudooceanicola algae]|uniref:Spermidine/putrescine transport system permease protein PotB n=1 Tax=Pseudooceanicola algae TaxID=1537215 RepID=A0A418SG83_9RHOB|nr:ABC transporter permease subunit [Pseudooceanicola algae]QPM91672.1 Spermidine/putrescine transport system permease protein PotB [Pseudooceanicola algae]
MSLSAAAPDLSQVPEPDRPREAALGVKLGMLALLAVLCLVPFLFVLTISFGHKIEGGGWSFGFETTQYKRFFLGATWPETFQDLYLQKLGYSLWFAAIGSLVAVMLAFPFTYYLTRLGKRGQTVWLVVLLSSLSLSEVFIVMGWDILLSARSGLPALLDGIGFTGLMKDLGWFQWFRDIGLASPRAFKFKTSGFATVLCMSYLVWPYAVILLYPALSRLDPALIEAARTMGARPRKVISTVVLPSVRLPLFGAALLLFVFLLGTYVTVSVFADPSQHTLAVSIYDSVRGSTLNAPFGAAQSVILLITAGLFLFAGQTLSKAGGK